MSIKMRVIRNRDAIESIEENDKAIFFSFRPSSKDLFEAFEKTNELKVLYLPKSYAKTLSKSMLLFLSMRKVQVIAGGIRDSDAVQSCYILDESFVDQEEPAPKNVEKDNSNVPTTGQII